MKPGGGKAKGSGFEGQVAKKLSAALQPLNFVRTQGSGARVGGKNYETIGKMFGEDALKLFVGDVVPTNERDTSLSFRYSVETKFYKETDNFTSLVSGTALVFKWMRESMDDAAKINKTPMIVFKWNRTPIFMGILTKDNQGYKPSLTLIDSRDDRLSIDIFLFEDMLKERDFWIK